MPTGPSTFPKLILLLIGAVAAVLVFALSAGRRPPGDPPTLAQHAAAESDSAPPVTRHQSARAAPPGTRPPPAGPTRRPAFESADLPLNADVPTTPPEAGAHPYQTEDMVALDDSYDPEPVFDGAAEEFKVPTDLLRAIAYVESKGSHRHGLQTEDGGFGVMHLREREDQNTLDEAARLLQVGKQELVRDPAQNIRGAAALLHSYHDQAIVSAQGNSSPSPPWLVAVTLYSGRSPEEAIKYAREIENILHEGLTHAMESGQTLYINPGQAHLIRGPGEITGGVPQ